MKPGLSSSSSTGLAQEALLILSGHQSSLLDSSTISTNHTKKNFHPSSIECLNRISSISKNYRSIDSLTKDLINSFHSQPSNQNNKRQNQNGNEGLKDTIVPSNGILGLCSSILRELKVYEEVLIELELRLLSHDPRLVPIDNLNRPTPPLTGIVAEIIDWESIFKGLSSLLDQLTTTNDNQDSDLQGSNSKDKSDHSQGNFRRRRWDSPQLVKLLYQRSQTGSPKLSAVLNRIQRSVERVWMDSFRAFVIYGQCPTEPLNDDDEDEDSYDHDNLVDDLFCAQIVKSQSDSGSNNNNNNYSNNQRLIQFNLRPGGLPNLPCLSPRFYISESIKQICRSLSVLNHLNRPISKDNNQNRSNSSSILISQPNSSNSKRFIKSKGRIQLPYRLQNELRKTLDGIDGPSHPRFRVAIEKVEEHLSNYLFTTYLTPKIILKTLRSITDVFLLRHTTLSSNLVKGFLNLREKRLKIESSHHNLIGSSRRRARVSVTLNDRELDVILLKASLSTDFGDDDDDQNFENRRGLSLDGFKFNLLSDNNQGSQPSKDDRSKKFLLFTKLLLSESHPTILNYDPPIALSLFITPKITSTYSIINSCLFSFLIIRNRLQTSLLELVKKDRLRNRWIQDRSDREKFFKRLCFEVLRKMNWFVGIMVEHFWRDVIDPIVENVLFSNFRNRRRTDQLRRQREDQDEGNGDDGLNNNYNNEDGEEEEEDYRLSGKNFYKTHQKFLKCLKIGLGLNDQKILRDLFKMIQSIESLINQFEGWNFELLPGLLNDHHHHHLNLNNEINKKGGGGGGDDDQIRLIVERKERVLKIQKTFEDHLKLFMVHLKRTEIIKSNRNYSSDRKLDKKEKPKKDYPKNYREGKGGYDDDDDEEEDDESDFDEDDCEEEEEEDDDEIEDDIKKEIEVEGLLIRRRCIESLILKLDFNKWFT